MKYRLMALFVATAGLGLLAGCETLSETPGENYNTIAHGIDINLHQVPEDTERLLLLDRPTWLSKKPVPSY